MDTWVETGEGAFCWSCFVWLVDDHNGVERFGLPVAAEKREAVEKAMVGEFGVKGVEEAFRLAKLGLWSERHAATLREALKFFYENQSFPENDPVLSEIEIILAALPKEKP